ncbi:MAG TPA: Rap1a/Tai family immunity protein [Steroidobacteraceae bacterium]|nr:Rap1a/Tai family immunity protein [Steroidobacteraceae bacterium]
MKIILTSLGVAATLLAVPADAAEAAMTAGDLKELCAGSDHVSRNVCRIYILGVTEGIAQGLSIAGGKGSKPCIPEGVSAEQLEETVKSRLEKELSLSPARGATDAAPFLASTLAEAFPCAKSKTAQH